MSGGKSRPRRQKSGGGSRFGNLSGRINGAERIFGGDPKHYVQSAFQKSRPPLPYVWHFDSSAPGLATCTLQGVGIRIFAGRSSVERTNARNRPWLGIFVAAYISRKRHPMMDSLPRERASSSCGSAPSVLRSTTRASPRRSTSVGPSGLVLDRG